MRRPRWLNGWSVWTSPLPVAPKEASWWQKLVVFVGYRKEW